MPWHPITNQLVVEHESLGREQRMPSMDAETRFKLIVVNLLRLGVYPSPSAIRNVQLRLDGKYRNRNLNGRECKWRNESWEPWMSRHPLHPITKRRRELEGHP